MTGVESGNAAAPRRRGSTEYRMIPGPKDPPHVLKPARAIGMGEGYVMVRRPGANTAPFVITEGEWNGAPRQGEA